ncbi:hypothetical protein C1O63_0319 [Dehalococcoides mccartyi]|nr:hypothetical protein C1O63_0319 [Dehalococcoides mccartyi]
MPDCLSCLLSGVKQIAKGQAKNAPAGCHFECLPPRERAKNHGRKKTFYCRMV